MFDLNTRLQLAAIFIFVIMLVDFLIKKKLPLLSAKHFAVMLLFTAINLIFDVLTVFTLVNFETIPGWVNRLFHQIFIGSLNCLILFLFLYVDSLCKKERRIRLKDIRILKMLPFVAAMIMVFFGPLDYKYTDVVYSYGLMADTVYVCVAFYMFLSIFELIKYRKNLSTNHFCTIITGIMLWIIVAIVQMLNPSLLLSSIALVGMLVILYFSFENPKEHRDEETDCFNRSAFFLVINEVLNSKKNYSIINIALEDYYIMNSTYGYEKGNMVLTSVSRYIKSIGYKHVFHINGNVMSFISYDEVKLNSDLELIRVFLNSSIPLYKGRFDSTKSESYGEIPVISHIDIVLKENILDTSVNRIISIIDFMAEKKYGGEEDTKIMYFKDEIIKEEARKQKILEIVKTSLKNDGFEMVYQPIYDINKKRFASAEALVRIKDNTTIGFISPEEFIPIVEKYGLMNDLGDIIFNMICRFIMENKVEERGLEYIEVNLSAIQCVDIDLPKKLNQVLEKNNVSSNFINLEITETAVITSNENLDINMRELRKLGCSFSMDDFGTGYSNLSKVAEVQYDIIKLDKSLIWPCFAKEKNPKAMSILDNITQMLFDLDQEVVAEGVETKEQYDYLVAHHVTHIQGYYFSKPLKEKDFLTFIDKKNCE